MLDNLPAPSVPARTLGEFACGLAFEHIPTAVLERAKLLILDALGCGIAASAYGFADAALAGATALGGIGRCSVIGRADRLPVRDAALVNGMLIHGLDFADTHLASIVHATAACLPTALTFGEELGVDGRGLLVAYAAGMETAIRIGAAAKGGFHHTGFHATGVVAHFSASVVAARLLDLPSEAIVAGHRRQHRFRGPGLPGGRCVDQAHASGMGRSCRYHRRPPGPARLQGAHAAL